MGRLAGFSYQEIARRLRIFGFEFDRLGAGSHELWRHPVTLRRVIIPCHRRDMAEGTLWAILRHAGISVEDFLSLE